MADLERDPLVKLGLAGALSREMDSDHEQFVQFLATAMQAAFPNQAELKYEGGFLSKKRLSGLSFRFADDIYALSKPARGPLESTRTHVVRGIALKTETLPVSDWLEEISAKIEESLEGNTNARAALARALGL